MSIREKLLVSAVTLACISQAQAHESVLAGNTKSFRPDGHAPIGVMGDHMHKQGEWMIAYRYMHMNMEDNLAGSDAISPAEIVSSIPNPNGPPPTVRVVPTKMTTQMHMLGAMYAPSDNLTLMAMVNYLDKEMDHHSFMGMMGTTKLGTFTTASSGIGDTKVSALVGLHSSQTHKIHLNLGLSLPTGSIDESGTVLSPMNTRPTLRLPYAMQLGSGTYDLEPGVTYSGRQNRLGWGAQYKATLPVGSNDENYTLGDSHQLTGWGSYRVSDRASASLRLTYLNQDAIDGSDPQITAPVTTANPANYGGERLDLGIGFNLIGQSGAIAGHRLAMEYAVPIEQDVNGVQMEMQSMLTIGYQYAF